MNARGSRQPTKTSAYSIASFALALAAFACFGPITAIPAVIIGIVGIVEIRGSNGTKGGNGFAIAGITVGGINTLIYAAIFGFSFYAASRATHSSSPTSPSPRPTFTLSATSPSKPLPTTARTPGYTVAAGRGIAETATTETKVGRLMIVNLGSSAISLRRALQTQQRLARKAKQRLVLQTTTTRCRPCLGVAASLSSAAMQSALRNVRLVRVDTRSFRADLIPLGIPVDVIPGFYLLDPKTQTPGDGVNGGEWDDDTATNIAPVLGQFVRGRFNKRREPFHPVESPHQGTIL